MNTLYEITKELNLLFCINNEVGQTPLYALLEEEFSTVKRISPELLYKYINQNSCDLIVIDQYIEFNEVLRMNLQRVQKDYPRVVIMAEVASQDLSKLSAVHELNIDRVLLHPLDSAKVSKLLERSFHTRYELIQNEKYEQHLEEIIFGQSRQLHSQETLDKLTGLKNITSLKKRFTVKAERGLLFLDVDNFDTINTLYGMLTGDKVLLAIAKRIEKFLPKSGEVYRLSADEFAIIVENMSPIMVRDLGEQLVALFNEAAISIGDLEFDIGFSIGFDYGHSYEIFHNAKLANREAKSLGGRSSVKYDKQSLYLLKEKENYFWTNEIKEALKSDRVIVYYQPIFDTQLEKITKYEALARIENSNGDIITPNFFIVPAMAASLLSSISRVIIDKSFKEFSKNDYNFSINLSEQDFTEGYLEKYLSYKCDYYNIEPSRVYLEILEEMSIKNSVHFDAQVSKLQSLGFKFSIDDFGVEKSNFSRVLAINADMIKIDGSFVRTLQSDVNSTYIVESIIALAKRINAKTVAEYVEDKQTYDILKKMGVDYAQGYHIGEPLSGLVS